MIQKIKGWVFFKLKGAFLAQNFTAPNSKVSTGSDCICTGNIFGGNIYIGKNCNISRSELYGEITIGNYTNLNGPCLDIYAGNGNVSIGNFCSIARNVSMQVDAHNYNKTTSFLIFKNIFFEQSTNEVISKGNITIGHDVWIGAGCKILSGVTIGNGAVVGANAVVTKDIQPFAIVGGNPATVIKYRFSQEIIDKIQKIAWWDWPIEKIKNHKWLFEKELTLQMLEKIK